MRVILIDDEPIALDVLESLLSAYGDIKVAGKYTDPMAALKAIKSTQPDVLFLDIEMGAVNGLEMVEDFIGERTSIEIVFITAYSKYAVNAFETNAMDYLLKPVQQKRLDKTIKRLRDRLHRNESSLEEIDHILKVDCFDAFHVMDGKGNPLIWRTRKSKELFAYLFVHQNTPIPRDLILDTIFSDKSLEQATTLLHTTVYQLRKNLEKAGFKHAILYYNGRYQLNIPMESDFEKAKQILDLKSPRPRDIEEMIHLYTGDFLEQEGYHWALGIQKNLKQSVLDILIDFTNTQLAENSPSPLLGRTLELAYRMEPFDENIVGNILQYYGQQGNIHQLKSFFEDYTRNLQQELNIKPKESTIQRYKKYLNSMEKPWS